MNNSQPLFESVYKNQDDFALFPDSRVLIFPSHIVYNTGPKYWGRGWKSEQKISLPSLRKIIWLDQAKLEVQFEENRIWVSFYIIGNSKSALEAIGILKDLAPGIDIDDSNQIRSMSVPESQLAIGMMGLVGAIVLTFLLIKVFVR